MDLKIDDVTLVYPDGDSTLTAVDHVSLLVPSGTTTALLGPSGSGKSSLLAVAGGLTPPTSGTVTFGSGEPLFTTSTSRDDATRARLERIGFVFQQPQLIASLTALEQLELLAHLRGQRASSSRDRSMAALDAVGLADWADKRPGTLSGGQRQRVAIARALVSSPDVLLVDEPTSALDHERGVEIIDLITSLGRDLDAATIIVSHDRSSLAAADRYVHLVDGQLVEEETAA